MSAAIAVIVLFVAVSSYAIGVAVGKRRIGTYDHESAAEDAYRNWQKYVYDKKASSDPFVKALSEAFAEWAEYAYMEGCDDTREKFDRWYRSQVKSQQEVLDGLLKKVESDRKTRDKWAGSL